MREPATRQRGDGRGVWRWHGGVMHSFGRHAVVRFGFAGFEGYGIGGQRTSTQSCGYTRDDVLVWGVAMQEQYFDERAGAVSVSVRFAGSCPPGIVSCGELSCGAGLFERGRSG